jgi:hypothetical protein
MVFPKNKVETELNAFSAGGLVERVRARYVYNYCMAFSLKRAFRGPASGAREKIRVQVTSAAEI